MTLTSLLALMLMFPTFASRPIMPPLMRHMTAQPGYATYYANSVMEQVVANRAGWGQLEPCDECAGAVAVRNCADIGRRLWIVYNGALTGPYLVADCANPRDLPAMIRRNGVVELSRGMWVRLGMPDAPELVELWWQE